jgi:anti-sigma regulatory factor (Ser/Thr protein kinase)
VIPEDRNELSIASRQTQYGRTDGSAHGVRRGIVSAVAALLVILPLAVAAASGILGYLELRDALTFDVRGLHALAIRTQALRLGLDEERDVVGYATKRLPLFRESYHKAAPQLALELRELETVSIDLAVPDGPNTARAIAAVHDRWVQLVAQPLMGRPRSAADIGAALRRDPPLITTYRKQQRILGKEIRDRIIAHQRSFSGLLFRIACLFLASVAMCALGISLGAWQLIRLDRARGRAEATLHEREILFARDRSWSRSFARAVLPPSLPAVTGCRFDAVYEPGANDRHVGGDWYDAVRLVDGRVLVSIGDVAGSGVEAAVVMGAMRQIMRGIAQLHADPALMLDAADRALRLEHHDVFVTAWVGIIDLVTRELTFSSAGHPPALLTSPAGTMMELRDLALPLGLREGHQGTSTTLVLDEGSMLALYTDGLSEETHDVLVGEALVRQAVQETSRRPWLRPASEIQRRVLLNGSMDDVAILVARVNFAEAERHIRRVVFDVQDASAAREARDVVLGIVAARAFRPDERANVAVVFGELIGNVVRHVSGASEVQIAVDCGGPQTVLHVLDRGLGFRHTSLLPPDPMAESGRGLFLVSALTGEFTVAQREGGGSHARATLVGGSPQALVCSALESAERASQAGDLHNPLWAEST